MNVTFDRQGKFASTIGTEDLSKGLRMTASNPRNKDSFVEVKGAVGYDKVLQSLEPVVRVATTLITDAFPFPQLFVFTNMIIVCGLLDIYEWVGTNLSIKYSAAVAGGIWSAVDLYDCIYMSNGKISVVRDAGSKLYELSSLPTASAICNYNGQIMISSPGIYGLGASLIIAPPKIGIGIEQLGVYNV